MSLNKNHLALPYFMLHSNVMDISFSSFIFLYYSLRRTILNIIIKRRAGKNELNRK